MRQASSAPGGGWSLFTTPVPWIVLGLSLAATAVGWYVVRNNVHLGAEKRFDEEAYRISAALGERMLIYQDVLHGAVGLFASSYSVERDEWKAYVESVSIDRRFPGIAGLGFIENVRRSELDKFIAATRDDRAPGFQVQSAGNADLMVTKFIEPQRRYGDLLGQDIALDPQRKVVAEQARDTGDAAITGTLTFTGRQTLNQSGFLMLLPVYENHLPHRRLEDRRANLHGWVYARFVTTQLMEGILGDRSPTMIDFEIFDDTPGAPVKAIFTADDLPEHNPMFTRHIPYRIGGRQWRLEFSSRPAFEKTIPAGPEVAAAGGGLLLSLLLFGIVYSLSTTRERALGMASEMTTALRAANERLEYEKYLLQALMDNVPDRIFFKDREHRFIRINRAHLRKFGVRDPEEAIGKTDFDFFEHEHARQAFEREEEIAKTGQPITKEQKETWPDGSVTWSLITKMPLRNASDKIVGTFGISRDITDRKEAEDAMRRAKEAAEDANRTKSKFLASMSHELRTPLNSIIGFANILMKNKAGTLSVADLNFLDRIQANGKHLLALINDILDLSKIEAQKFELRKSAVGLDRLVRETIAQEEGLLKDKPVELVAELPEKVAPILTDPDKLKQVLINLIGNALKFTERGKVVVRVITDMVDDHPTLLEVSDTGIGITQEKLGVIFEAFQQGDEGTARRYGGTGLGLTISQALCRMMGYRIEARSEVGRGSTFTVILSGAGAPASAPAEPPLSVAAAGPDTRAPILYGDLSGKIVLVIDDEADSRTLVTHAIEEAGCHVIASDSGELGLIMARKLRPDLITTDLLMPGMDGWQVLRAIKTDPELQTIPVVIVSVVAGENRGRIFGAVEILQKPVQRDEVIRAMQRTGLGAEPKALIVDDEEDSRRFLSACLGEHASEVWTASNGKQALELIKDHAPDVVLLDLVMPEMDGLEFLNAFRADVRYQHVPVLVITGKDLSPAEAGVLREETIAVTKKSGAFEGDLKRLVHLLLTREGDGKTAADMSQTAPKA